MAFGREVAEAYIEVHGDMEQFRKDLEKARGYLQDFANGFQRDMTPLTNAWRSMDFYVESFGRKLRGLSGLNVLEDSFRMGIRFFENIDRNAVRIGNMVTLVGTAISGVTNMVGAVAAISADLAGLSAIGFLAPGFLTAFGIGLGVTIAAFKDMKTVLADLAPSFARLQDNISARFWAQAEQPIRNLVSALLPALDANLQRVATSIGGMFGELADSMREVITIERMTGMFDKFVSAIDIATTAIRPLTEAFVSLGEVGSQYFERFATWIVDLSNQFNDFIQRSVNNGDMNRWIEAAIQGFQDVGRAIGASVEIIDAINDAFQRAGGGGLKEFADRLQAAADIMNGPAFQGALTQFFTGTLLAMDGLFDAIGRLGPAFQSLGPTFVHTGQEIGDTLRGVGDILATIFSNRELQVGFENFMTSVRTSVESLAPAAAPFAESLGGILTLMGQVLEAVSRIGAQILIEWGPVLDGIGEKMGQLVGPLSDTLSGIVSNLTPVLQGFSDNVVGPLIPILEDALAIAGDVVEILSPAFVGILGEVGQLLREDVGPGFDQMRQGVEANKEGNKGFAESFAPVMQAVEDFLNIASSPQATWEFLNSQPVKDFNADVNDAFGTFWQDTKNNFQTGVTDLNNGVNQWLADMWNGWRTSAQEGVDQLNSGVNEGLAQWGRDLSTGIANLNTSVNEGLAQLWEGFMAGWNEGFATFNADVNRMAGEIWTGFINGLTQGAINIGTGIIDGFTRWVDDVRSFFGIHSPSTLMMQMGTDIVQGFINGLLALIGQVGAVAGQIAQGFIAGFTGIVEFLGGVWANISASFAGFIAGFIAGWNGFWAGLGPMVSAALAGIGTFIATVWATIVASFQAFVGGFVASWNAFWQGLGPMLQGAFAGVGAFLSAAWQTITATFQAFVAGFVATWNAFWSGLGAILGGIWAGIIATVSAAWAGITAAISAGIASAQAFIQNFLSAVQATWNSNWQNISQFVSTIWSAIVNFVQSGIQNAQNAVSNGVQAISNAWNNAWNAISQFVSSAWSNITSFISNGISQAQSFVANGIAQISSAWSNGWSQILSFVSSAFGNIVSTIAGGIGQAVGAIAGGIGQMVGTIAGGFGQMVGIVAGAIGQFVGSIASGAGQAVGAMSNMVGQIIGVVGGLAGRMVSAGVQAMQGFINGVTSMIGSVIASVTNAVGGAIEGAKRLLGIASPSKVFRNFGEMTGEGFAIGMDNMGGALKSAAERMAETVTSAFDTGNMYERGRDAALGLADGLESNARLIERVMADITPTATAKFEALAGGGGTTRATETVTKVITFSEGAIQLVTPSSQPGVVASQFIDEFANLSNF